MAAFWTLFAFSITNEAAYSPNSSRCSVDPSYLDLGILFLVDTTQRVEILPQKCFVQGSMGKTAERVTNSFVRQVDDDRQLRSSQNVASAILPS